MYFTILAAQIPLRILLDELHEEFVLRWKVRFVQQALAGCAPDLNRNTHSRCNVEVFVELVCFVVWYWFP